MKSISKAIRYIIFSFLILVILLSLIFVIAYAVIRGRTDFERDAELFALSKNTSVTHFFADGGDGAEYVPVEIEATAFGGAKKVWYPIDEVSDYVKKGFVAIEDREFYTHNGVNFRRTFGAFLNYLFGGAKRYGASTITQQVVKNISGDNDPTPSRKASEIIRALEIEKRHGKDEILEMYMNVAPMSENIIGVGYASDRYFGKEPSELSLAESATIVGITNSPTRFDPVRHPEACIERRRQVLLAMREMGFITEEERLEADTEALEILPSTNDERSWFVETVIEDVVSDLAKERSVSDAAARLILMKGGYNVYMTERESVQTALEEIFENPANFPAEIADGLEFSMCICDSKTGDLLGIVGSAGKKRGSGLLNHATVPHPPGSCLKPIALYAPLINKGRISWASVLDDTPVSFTQKDGEYIEYPRNSPERYDGLITVKDALRLSKNTVAVKLYDMLGGREIFNSLKNDFGFDTLVEHGESYSGTGTVSDIAPSPLALGQLSYGVPLRTLTEAYTVFPSEGVVHSPRSYLFVTDKEGNTVLAKEKTSKEVFSPLSSRIMNQLLMNVVADGTAKRITLKHEVDTAGKTGTSSDGRDRLFVGYTPYYTAGIWCGYPGSGESVGALEITHLDVWDRVMRELHSGIDCSEHFSVDGLVLREYCRDSGELPDAVCALDPRGDRIEYGYFSPDNIPTEYCTRHRQIAYDPTRGTYTDAQKPFSVPLPLALPVLPERDFPKEITVTDEEFSYQRKVEG